jgi:hypothetical protein
MYLVEVGDSISLEQSDYPVTQDQLNKKNYESLIIFYKLYRGASPAKCRRIYQHCRKNSPNELISPNLRERFRALFVITLARHEIIFLDYIFHKFLI